LRANRVDWRREKKVEERLSCGVKEGTTSRRCRKATQGRAARNACAAARRLSIYGRWLHSRIGHPARQQIGVRFLLLTMPHEAGAFVTNWPNHLL
jgi:hypothetical protein